MLRAFVTIECMFKKMMMKALLGKQLKGLPKEMQDQIVGMVEKNPKFFEKMGKEIKARTDAGEDQMMATQMVARTHQAELQAMFMDKEEKRP